MPDQLALFVFETPARGADLASQVVRENFMSLGTTNYTTNPAYPKNPRKGMLRVFDLNGAGTNIKLQQFLNGSWTSLVEHLELLLSLCRRREINCTGAVWTVNHGLGFKPVVQCYDALHQKIEPTTIQHVLIGGEWSRTVVTHAAPVTGYVILVG